MAWLTWEEQMIANIRQIAKQLWTTAVIGGAISIIFGLIAMLWPHFTLSFFIYLFSIFVLLLSVIVLGQAFVNIRIDRLWWLSMLFAICGISIGVFILVNPDVAQAFLAVLMAVYIFSQSVLDLAIASYSDDKQTKTPVVIMGILGIIFGFMVLLYPKLATEALVWVIGLYVVAHGVIIEYYAIKVRRQAKTLSDAIEQIADTNDGDASSKKTAKKTKTRKSSKKSAK